MILTYHLPLNNALYRFLIVLLIFEVFMRNNDIYTIQRKIFIKKKYSLMRVQGIISKDQLIDLAAVFGGLLLVWLLLAL